MADETSGGSALPAAAEKSEDTVKDSIEGGDDTKAHTTQLNGKVEEGSSHLRTIKRGQTSRKTKPSFRDNVKTDFTSLPESNNPDEIRKQVEFYFSDSNLYQDNYLLKETGGSENKPVPISTIHKFKRMRRFQPYSAVVAALKESKVLEITEKEEIKRKTSLPEISKENSDDTTKIAETKALPRSIYAKGFGEEGPSTQFDIEAFFTPYGPISAVRLRRTREKIFKGSVFVEFDSEDIQKAFLELESKPKYKDQELKIMSKKAYIEMKMEEDKGRNATTKGKHWIKDKRAGNRNEYRKGRDRNSNRPNRDSRLEKSIQGEKSKDAEESIPAEDSKKRAREEDEADGADVKEHDAKKSKSEIAHGS